MLLPAIKKNRPAHRSSAYCQYSTYVLDICILLRYTGYTGYTSYRITTNVQPSIPVLFQKAIPNEERLPDTLENPSDSTRNVLRLGYLETILTENYAKMNNIFCLQRRLSPIPAARRNRCTASKNKNEKMLFQKNACTLHIASFPSYRHELFFVDARTAAA